MTDARWEVSLPEGAKVADVRNGNDSAMSYSEKDGIVSIPMKTNLSMWYSNYQPQITVGFPREAYNGAETVVSAKLVGTYADYTQPEVAAQAESRFTMNADDYDFKYTGSMYGTGKTHGYNAKIIYGNMMSEAGADFTYYISALARCAEGDDATVEVVDDFHDALLNNGQMRQLGSDEYGYKSITIPSSTYWKNGNGQAAEAGKYTARVMADTGEGFAEVQSVAVDTSSHAVKLPEGTTRVKVAVDGVSSVLNVSNLTVTVNYHPAQEGDMYAPESIAPEGSIRSTVGLIVSKDGEVVNAVGRDSYTGTYGDVVADRDMATYGAKRAARVGRCAHHALGALAVLHRGDRFRLHRRQGGLLQQTHRVLPHDQLSGRDAVGREDRAGSPASPGYAREPGGRGCDVLHERLLAGIRKLALVLLCRRPREHRRRAQLAGVGPRSGARDLRLYR